MKNSVLAVLFLLGFVLSSCVTLHAGTYDEVKSMNYPQNRPYFQVETNVLRESYGMRGGSQGEKWDVSGGFLTDVIDDADLHTIDLTIYRILFKRSNFTFKGGLGGGVTIINLPDDRGTEKADTAPSWSVGGQAEYALGTNWSLVGSVKGQFLHTTVHRTDTLIETETLSTGDQVETDTPVYSTYERDFSNVQVGFAVKCSF